MRIDPEARAALEERNLERHVSGEGQFRASEVYANAAADLRRLLSRMESEPEGELHDGSCDYCGFVPTLPRHVCMECWERLGSEQ